MNFYDTLSTTIAFADQAAAEIRAATDDDSTMLTLAGPGLAQHRLHEHLVGLPVGDVRKLVVLMYCGHHGERNVDIAGGFIESPKNVLVDQLMSKGRLGSHLRAGRMMVPLERLRRLERVA